MVDKQSDIFAPGEFAGRPPEFELFWRSYPKRRGKRVGKSAALRQWCRLKPHEQCEALEAARNYAKSDVVRKGYCRDAARFLGGDFWRDWLDGPGEVDERKYLIDELKRHTGRRYQSGVVISTGVSYMHADVPWENFSIEGLKKMLEALEWKND